jgi:uncharacterized SAM-binding protein YcdF (DUF218 family)
LSRRRTAFRLSVKHLLLGGLLILAVLVGVRWEAALTSLGAFLVDAQPPQPADLALVLGGDFWGPRVLVGAELAKQGYAPLTLISGPRYYGAPDLYGRPEGDLAIDFLVQKGYPKQLFQFVITDADSTITEARALRDELARRQVRRVLLVTSNYHSRRATIVLSLFCPGVTFISVPARDTHYHIVNWWTDDSSRRLFFSEWKKILGSVFMEYPKELASRIF